MRAGLLATPGRISVEERPDPTPGPGEVIVSLAACGICGSDLEKVKGNYRATQVIGHEPVGTVAAIGAGVTGLSVGTRVFAHHHVPCYACPACYSGAYTYCPSYTKTNLDPGGFADQFRVPAVNVSRGAVLPLAPSVSWEDGALLEPAGCALTALRTVGLPPATTVMVLGLGPVGILYARLARTLGAGWIGGADPSSLRRTAAGRRGTDAAVDSRNVEKVQQLVQLATGGRGVDLAVVATSAASAVPVALSVVRRGGTVNLFGLPEAGSRLEEDLQQLYLRGLKVIPTYATTERDIAEVHSLLAAKRFEVRDLVTHRFPLDQLPEAFQLAAQPEKALKVVSTGPAYSG
ncbi:MAG TPA: alcohol dehydrogenase catalytic domain-containing protein [Thermoplasmata archaeon]|nr:alcohol dehydrogenase catalytic domain-containing protein [Thermoplasmata archaeon]